VADFTEIPSRLFSPSGIFFKGSGFYVTDSQSNHNRPLVEGKADNVDVGKKVEGKADKVDSSKKSESKKFSGVGP
jgi:hypothetical protein